MALYVKVDDDHALHGAECQEPWDFSINLGCCHCERADFAIVASATTAESEAISFMATTLRSLFR